jgi:hypothetical protein
MKNGYHLHKLSKLYIFALDTNDLITVIFSAFKFFIEADF